MLPYCQSRGGLHIILIKLLMLYTYSLLTAAMFLMLQCQQTVLPRQNFIYTREYAPTILHFTQLLTKMGGHSGDNQPLLIFQQPQSEPLQYKMPRGLSYGNLSSKIPVLLSLVLFNPLQIHVDSVLLTPDDSSCYRNKAR